MSTEQTIGRLTAEIEHLTRAVAGLTEQVSDLRKELDQARGAVFVLRWLGFGSLAALIATAGGLAAWFKAFR